VTERVLTWEGCLNVRDLGGHVTEDGRTTTFGAVVRADSVRHLTDAGWDALVDYGVRTIVDLRRHDELERDPPLDVPVDVVHVPIDDAPYYDELQASWRQEGDHDAGVYSTYVRMTELLAPNFARAVQTVAEAPPGGVVVHCFAGKDRTGLTCAMVLRTVGVSIEDIADDYTLSEGNIRPIIDPWADAAHDDHERALRLRIGSSPRQVMVDALTELELRHGDIPGYLREAGVPQEALDRVRDRLLG
jgi:protein tyrosine/serine phosphatase